MARRRCRSTDREPRLARRGDPPVRRSVPRRRRGRCARHGRRTSGPAATSTTCCCPPSSPSGSRPARRCGNGGALCRALGTPAPGPPEIVGDLLLPPRPRRCARRPTWWFHPFGIETKRARTLIEVARHHEKLWGWSRSGSATVDRQAGACCRASGRGPWAACSDRRSATPMPFPSATSTSPTSWPGTSPARPAGDDRRMLELLEPYRASAAVSCTPSSAPGVRRRRSDRAAERSRSNTSELRSRAGDGPDVITPNTAALGTIWRSCPLP